MSKVDFTRLTKPQLKAVARRINSEKYPENYKDLLSELMKRGIIKSEDQFLEYSGKPVQLDIVQEVFTKEGKYVPNRIAAPFRIMLLAYSIYLIYFSIRSCIDNEAVIHLRRSTLIYHGIFMWLAIISSLFAVAGMVSIIVDHYDTRQNQRKYKNFQIFAFGISGVIFIFLLFLGGLFKFVLNGAP